MVDQDTNVQLVKLIRSLTDLGELYDTYYQQQSNLHIRPADIPTSEVFYELSIDFSLLDNDTQSELDPYMEEVTVGSKTLHGNHKIIKHIIPLKNVEKVAEIIGIETQNVNKLKKIFDQFVNEYERLYQLLVQIFYNQEQVDVYYGTKYYPRKIEAQHAFSIDEDNSLIYMMDYGTDNDVPDIYQHDFHDTLIRAIKLSCYPEDEVAFYTTY